MKLKSEDGSGLRYEYWVKPRALRPSDGLATNGR